MDGWIKLHRKTLKHWIWSNEKYLKAWIYCLFRANFTDNKVLIGSNLIELEPGEFITSICNFADDTGLTTQTVRTFWKLLEDDEMITKISTSKATKLTVCNYESYQVEQQTDNNQATNQQQTSNKPATTVKKVKNEKEFKEEILSYSDKFDNSMLNDFFLYWSEWNKSKTKMRWQMEKTWQLDRRLATWFKRSKNYNKQETKNLYPGYTDSSFD